MSYEKPRSMSVLKRLIATVRDPDKLASLMIEHALKRSETETYDEIWRRNGGHLD